MSDAFYRIANPCRGNAREDVRGIYAYAMSSHHYMTPLDRRFSSPELLEPPELCSDVYSEILRP
jgi:hypothetical protein